MNDTEQALTESVAKAMHNAAVPYDALEVLESWEEEVESYERDGIGNYVKTVRAMAHAALTTIRQHDEQAALNCGHCTPNTDEIACACQIKERDDE